ncbi:hypothetical protein niasHT_015076 [Heterodera trifolii]|uniref:Uncharacterized protein n=1 Tax=Heterodera trifolii TaxID=157864 RepID=A0ABD2L9G7_9BILA
MESERKMNGLQKGYGSRPKPVAPGRKKRDGRADIETAGNLTADGRKHQTSLKKPTNDDVIKLFVRDVFDHYNLIGSILYDGYQATVIDYSKIEAVLCDGDHTQITDSPKLNSNCDQPARGNGQNVDQNSAKTGKNGFIIIININLKNLGIKKCTNTNSSIRPCFEEELTILKSIDQPDKRMINLLGELYKTINDFIALIEFSKQKAKIHNLKKMIADAAIVMAKQWHIPANEIMPLGEGQKIEHKSMLEELAQLWSQYKSHKPSENADDNHENHQRRTRMLKLIMDFAVDEVDGLANLKENQQRQRRRRKKRRSSLSAISLLIGVLLFCCLAIWLVNKYCNFATNSSTLNEATPNYSEIDDENMPALEIVPSSPPKNALPKSQQSRDGKMNKKKHCTPTNSESLLKHNYLPSQAAEDPLDNAHLSQFGRDQLYYSSHYGKGEPSTRSPYVFSSLEQNHFYSDSFSD